MADEMDSFFNEKSESMAQRTYELAAQYKQNTIDVSHVFMALLDSPDETLSKCFGSLSLDREQPKAQTLAVIKHQERVLFWRGAKQKMFRTRLLKESIEEAIALSKGLNKQEVMPVHIFWGLTSSLAGQRLLFENRFQLKMHQIFDANHITPDRVMEALKESAIEPREERKD